MEICPPSRPSVHSSTDEQNRAKQQFSQVNHLIRSSYQPDRYQHLSQSVQTLSSSTLSPLHGNLHGVHSGHGEIPHDDETADASEWRRQSSSSTTTEDITTAFQRNSPLINTQHVTEYVTPQLQPFHVTAHNQQDVVSKARGYRVTKYPVSRNNVIASGEVVRKSTHHCLQTRQATNVSNRPSALHVVRPTHDVRHGLRDASIRPSYRQVRPPKVSNPSLIPSRIHLGIPISALLLSPPNSPQVDEHFREAIDVSVPLADATSLTPVSSRPASQHGSMTPSQPIPHWIVTPRSTETQSIFTSRYDTWDIDERFRQHYLNTYFDEVNPSLLGMLPRGDFIEWALGSTWKPVTDRMMLYALMSSATFHSNLPIAASHRDIFRTAVHGTLDMANLQPCLQNVHLLLFLTLTACGEHRSQEAVQIFARCVDIMHVLRLNSYHCYIEEPTAYNLTVNIASECLQRTFGAAFCFDSHMQLGNPLLHQMTECEDTASRLFYANDHDQKWLLQQPVSKQRSDSRTSSLSRDFVTTDDVSHVIQITRIYADIGALVAQNEIVFAKSGRHPDDQLDRNYLRYRLRIWSDAYNNIPIAEERHIAWMNKCYNSAGQCRNLDRRPGGLNMLYHLCHMKLNRRTYHCDLTDSELSSRASLANLHAIAVLRLAEQTMAGDDHAMRDYRFVTRNFSTASAICEAVDILTAVGRITDILEPGSRIMSLMYSSLDLLHQLGSWWGFDLVKYDPVKRRIQMVYRAAEAALILHREFFYYSDPIDKSIDREFDLVYGPDRGHYIILAYPDVLFLQDEDMHAIHTDRTEDGY